METDPNSDTALDIEALETQTSNAIASTALQIGESLDKFHGPIWTAQIDLLKTLIQLSSGALVLTVTFSSSVLSEPTTPAWPWILFASWLFFSVTTIAALIGVWQVAGLRSLPARLHNLTPRLWETIKESIDKGADPIEAIQPLVSKATNVLKPFETRLQWSQRIAFATFVLAILSLAIFGWGQFQ